MIKVIKIDENGNYILSEAELKAVICETFWLSALTTDFPSDCACFPCFAMKSLINTNRMGGTITPCDVSSERRKLEFIQ